MSEPFIGQIALFGFNFAPVNWSLCQGQILPIAQYTALFSLLGTQFGGNGTTTFGLPDLQGRAAVGQGQLPGGGTYVVGEESGVESVLLTQGEIASHTHPLNATNRAGVTNTPSASTVLAQPVKGVPPNRAEGKIFNTGAVNSTLHPLSIQPAGSGQPQPHNNIQPSLALNYCIALNGVFPSRG